MLIWLLSIAKQGVAVAQQPEYDEAQLLQSNAAVPSQVATTHKGHQHIWQRIVHSCTPYAQQQPLTASALMLSSRCMRRCNVYNRRKRIRHNLACTQRSARNPISPRYTHD